MRSAQIAPTLTSSFVPQVPLPGFASQTTFYHWNATTRCPVSRFVRCALIAPSSPPAFLLVTPPRVSPFEL